MAEKEPFRICGQKASARVWNGIAKLFDPGVSVIETT
jgi:hypothetical protein